MTETADPDADYEPWWLVYLRACPPVMIHDWSCLELTPKLQEALCLMRLVCGSEQNLNVERRRWMEIALLRQGNDGLIYTPTRGRPWAYGNVDDLDFYVPHADLSVEQFLNPWSIGRMLSTMILHAQREGGEFWKQRALRIAEGMIDLAVDMGNIAYYWPSPLFARKDPPVETEPPG